MQKSTETRDRPAVWKRHFTPLLSGLVGLGFAVRLGYILIVGGHVELGLDAAWYVVQGKALADGHGYVDPRVFLLTGGDVPTANFPPLWPLVLAGANHLGMGSETGNRIVGALIGSVTVGITALLGRRVVGPGTGLIAAAIVAFSPALIAADGSLMAESLYVFLATATVLCAYRALDRPTVGRYASVGLLLGLAAITRSDALFLAPIMLIVLAWRADGVSLTRRFGLAAALVALFALPYGAWVAYTSVRMDAVVPTTTNAGNVFTGANCDSTYYGDLLGAWDTDCAAHLEPGGDEIAFASRGRDDGLSYARQHLARTPLVASARVLRTFGLWDPAQTAQLESVETRSATWQTIAWWYDLAFMLAAAAGAVVFVRRRLPIAPMVAVIIGVVVTAALSNGNQRFRLAADPSLAVLAAVAASALIARAARPQVDRST